MSRRERHNTFFAAQEDTSMPMMRGKPRAFSLRQLGQFVPIWASIKPALD
jgi:hypothetical protein